MGRVHEESLAAVGSALQPHWMADYLASRPKVEGMLGHLMSSKHGRRRSWIRGTTKNASAFTLPAAGVDPDPAPLAVLGVPSTGYGWLETGR